MKILIFGNPLVPEDSLAINLIPKLKEFFPQHEFIHLDPTENIDQYGKELFIIDVVHGINEPIIITNPNRLSTQKITSMHDFDLAYNLKLLLQANKINSVKILGLPYDMSEEEALKWVKENIDSKYTS